MTLADLPAINATLNATSAVLLCIGYGFIRRGKIMAHKTCMLAAFVVSVLFLVCYLIYHRYHGVTHFPASGWPKRIYYAILFPHLTLAIAIVPLALITLRRAFKEQFGKHVRIARWTLPIWLFVSITGVIVYWMLYHLYPVH